MKILCCCNLSSSKQQLRFHTPHYIAAIYVRPIRRYCTIAVSVALIIKKQLMDVRGYSRSFGGGCLSKSCRA